MNERPLAIVPVWFYDDQTGYQDFRQRIGALATRWRVVVVVRDLGFLRELDDLAVAVEVLPARGGSRWQMLAWCFRLLPWIANRRPDLVFLLGTQVAPLALGLPSAMPTLLYWNVHPSQLFDVQTRRLPTRWFNALATHLTYWAASKASLVFPIGQRLRQDLLLHKVLPLRAVTIPLGVSDVHTGLGPVSIRRLRRGETLRLVIAGSINTERGRDVMLEAIALLRQEALPVHLTMIGLAPAQLPALAEQVDRLGIGRDVALLGRLPGNEIPRYLAQAHIGLSLLADRPWYYFNPSTKVSEYLANGLAVIASDIASHRDLVTEGGPGWLCQFQAADLARVVKARLDSPESVAAASQNALAAGEKLAWSKLEPDFIALCRRAVAPTWRAARDRQIASL